MYFAHLSPATHFPTYKDKKHLLQKNETDSTFGDHCGNRNILRKHPSEPEKLRQLNAVKTRSEHGTIRWGDQ